MRHLPAGLVGFAIGVLTAFLGVSFVALGHGWGGGLIPSGLSLVGAPLGWLSWSLRKNAAGKPLAAFVVVWAAVADTILILSFISEDVSYFLRLWNGGTGFILFWAGLLLSWQILPVIVVLTSTRATEHPPVADQVPAAVSALSNLPISSSGSSIPTETRTSHLDTPHDSAKSSSP